MATAECLTPSPPISSSPGSLSSATSNTDSAPNPASPPAPSLNYFDQTPFPSTSKLRETNQSTSQEREIKRRNRLSTPLILEGSAVYDLQQSSHSTTTGESAGGTGKDGRRRRPSIRTRTLSLSFSPREQAFTPTTMRPSQSTVAAASFPFPSPARTGTSNGGGGGTATGTSTTNSGRSSPTNSTSSSRVPLDRSPSSASTSATRRPRPVRSSMSRIDPPSRSNSLRPPPASVPMSNRASTSSAEGEATQQLEAKVVILGSQGVGKTSIIARCTTGQFRNSLSSTVGASLLTKKIAIEGTQVRFQIWDPAGQERFRSMAPLYYRGALAAILVYDVTDESSFDDIKIWLEELRKNMTDELIILVVGAKADLSGSFRTIPLESAQRQVALWLQELDNPPESRPSTLHTPSLASGLNSPFPTLTETNIFDQQTTPRGSSPSSPSRSRTNTLPSNSHMKPQISTIPPSRPSTPSAALDRVRKMSTQLSNSREPSTSSNSNNNRSHHSKHPGLTASMTMPDLGSFTSSANSSSTIMPPPPPHSPSFQTLPQPNNLNPQEFGMVRSTSNKIGLSLSSLGMSAARRLSHDERMKRTWEDAVFERERERRDKEEAEEKRIGKLVQDCPVRVVEVSAKDGFGIEEVFHSIAEQLIVRKSEIEKARILRSRNSIMLHETPPIDPTRAGWCAC
ncbi:uncharacterized protein JCM6883_000557 [Sporobolomyces salmoneus]|uniref:uncharacterized protein n=1 Tax=Sporobolomyces salmoneus TaxID=183962 RepID=UPI00316BA985